MFFNSLADILAGIPAILLAITFHEYAHGKVAVMLGDRTPVYQGRLSLNPIHHLDPIGVLMLLLVGFGWAKPVQVNPYNFRVPLRRGMMYVGIAGPAMNLALAYLSAVGRQLTTPGGIIYSFWYYMLWFNVMLAVFNLIPLPPLDGSKVLAGFLPRDKAWYLERLEPYGPIILLVLLVTGVIGAIIEPGVRYLVIFFVHAAGLIHI